MPGITHRLPRLLALVPYLLARPGIRIDDAATDFDVTAPQLRRDLELLWMCGLPGYGPGDLIDLSFDAETVTVTFDAGMRRPLRLSTAEATALMVALRALADTPGKADAGAVRRALAKIESAAGQAEQQAVVVGLLSGQEAAAETVRDALARQRALHIHYYTASRDVPSERTIDPMRLLLVEGHSYLEAWCRSADAVRLFRLDRIDHVTVLNEVAEPPPRAEPVDVAAGLFQPHSDQRQATLHLTPHAQWVTEYYPVEDIADAETEGTVVRMRYADTGWMVRLVLGLGSDATVLEPPELAETVRERARLAVDRTRLAGRTTVSP